MAYIILDPGGDYPSEIVEFLGSTGRGAIAVFTDQGRYLAYQHMYADQLDGYILDAYLLSDWDDIRALGWAILSRWYGNLEGIIPWDEVSIEFGAALGDVLGLGWNHRSVIHRFRNKFAMKHQLRLHGDVRVNDSRVISTAHEAADFLGDLDHWPVVVKPMDGSGSRGVSFAWSWDDLMDGCSDVLGMGSGAVLLEEYVGGDEFVVNGLVDGGGDLLVTDVWAYDKRASHGHSNLYYATYKVPTHHPCFWPLAEYAGRVVERLGLHNAPIHMEVKYDGYGPCLIEVGARFSGGNLPVLASALHGRNLFQLAACHYLADFPVDVGDIDYGNYDRREAQLVTGIQPYPIARVSEVHGAELVSQLPSFHSFGALTLPGGYLPKTTDMYTRSYEVYLFHEDPAQVEFDAGLVRQLLHYS